MKFKCVMVLFGVIYFVIVGGLYFVLVDCSDNFIYDGQIIQGIVIVVYLYCFVSIGVIKYFMYVEGGNVVFILYIYDGVMDMVWLNFYCDIKKYCVGQKVDLVIWVILNYLDDVIVMVCDYIILGLCFIFWGFFVSVVIMMVWFGCDYWRFKRCC